MREVFIYIVFFVVLFIATSVILFATIRHIRFLNSMPSMQEDIKTATIKNISFSVEIADTAVKQSQGLSGHDPLTDNQGMLFIFARSGRYPFWMKGMEFPIDIIWIGEDKRIVDITKNAEPSSFPRLYLPKTPAMYVLEINAGLGDKDGFTVGDVVNF